MSGCTMWVIRGAFLRGQETFKPRTPMRGHQSRPHRFCKVLIYVTLIFSTILHVYSVYIINTIYPTAINIENN